MDWFYVFLIVVALGFVVTAAAFGGLYETEKRQLKRQVRDTDSELSGRNSGGEDVDVVYTWVDLSDQAWWKKFKEVYDAEKTERSPALHVKPQNNNEIESSVRSVLKFMPWVRNIYIITQRPQRPHNLPESEKIRIVHHDEIEVGPDKPTYNGMVTTSLHPFVPGLSDRYIYMDDDVTVCQPIEQRLFFQDGQPILRPTYEFAWWMFPVVDDTFTRIRSSTMRIIKKYANPKNQSTFYVQADESHRPIPVDREMAKRARRSIPDEEWNKLGRIRCPTDFAFHTYITNYAMRVEPEAVRIDDKNEASLLIVDMADIPDRMIKGWEKNPPHTLCINNQVGPRAAKFIERVSSQ